jgi:hypothetical protein
MTVNMLPPPRPAKAGLGIRKAMAQQSDSRQLIPE